MIANARCNPSGKVVPEGTIEHWVQVTDVRMSTEEDGSTSYVVQYLNPAENGGKRTLRISDDEMPKYFPGGLVAASAR